MRFAPLLLLPAAACSGSAPRVKGASVPRRPPQLEDAVSDEAALVLTLRSRALLEDPVYGPLLRRATSLAAGSSVTTVGATALAAFERSDDVVVVLGPDGGEPTARDALVAVRGAPADLDPAHLVDVESDTKGAHTSRPLWQSAGDIGEGVQELTSAEAPNRASLFVLPGRTWVIAVDDAVKRTRAVYARSLHVGRAPISLEDGELMRLELPGATLRHADARMSDGLLAPLGRAVERATVSLPAGARGLVLFHLLYPDAGSAMGAELRAEEVVGAFRRRLKETQTIDAWSWLGGAGVSREGKTVSVRAPIPLPWLRALAQADTAAFDSPPPIR